MPQIHIPPPPPSSSKRRTPKQQVARDVAVTKAKQASPAYQAELKRRQNEADQRAEARRRAAEKRASSPGHISFETGLAVKRKRAEQKALASSGIDPYVTIRNGRVVPVKTSNQAIKINGQPQTRSQMVSGFQRYNDLFLAYLGRNISAKEFQAFVNRGWSQQQIISNYLVKRPNFTKSPIWKQRAGDYTDVWHQIYGENSTPPTNLLKSAVINNLNQSTFADTLRHRPDYVNSNEFKTNTAQLSNVYTKIFGNPDARGTHIIQQAALAGWTEDQLAQWLRHQPEYTQSEEFQSKALGIASALGMITGSLPTLVSGSAPAPPGGVTGQNLPTDRREPAPAGGPNATAPLNVSPGKVSTPFGG